MVRVSLKDLAKPSKINGLQVASKVLLSSKSEIERATHKSVTSYTQIVYKLNNPFCKYSLSNGYSQCFAK